MRARSMLILPALLTISTAAQAQSASLWHVIGAISGRNVVLDCRLEPGTGACVSTAQGGKSYPLASLSEAGDQKRWSFKLKFAFIGVTLAFNGRVAGNQMSGTLTAAGRTGAFTAVRR